MALKHGNSGTAREPAPGFGYLNYNSLAEFESTTEPERSPMLVPERSDKWPWHYCPDCGRHAGEPHRDKCGVYDL